MSMVTLHNEQLTWSDSQERLSKAGISPIWWTRFLESCREAGLNLHSALLGRGAELLAEQYSEAVGVDSLHRLFSVSKSVTAVAIGCLADEGKLGLDNPLLTYYPEYQAGAHTWLAELTIRDMLRMETCHSQTTYKKDPAAPWVESFFTVEPDHAPGQHFFYDTSSSHVLAHLVERLSGQKLLDYLRNRGLRAAGFSDGAYFLEDPQGSPLGGSGLMATTRDFWVFARLVMQGGVHNGTAVFPADYLLEATSLQTETAHNSSFREESFGYGYMFWRHRDGWACYGMGGQLAICVPNLDLLLVTTADMQKFKSDLQRLFDLFFRHLVEPLQHSTFTGSPRTAEAALFSLPLAGSRQSAEKAAPRSGRWQLKLNKQNESAFLAYNEDHNEGQLTLCLGQEELALPFAFGRQRASVLPLTGHRVWTSAVRLDRSRVRILAQVIDTEVGFIELGLSFGHNLTLHMKNNIESCYSRWQGLYTGTAVEEEL